MRYGTKRAELGAIKVSRRLAQLQDFVDLDIKNPDYLTNLLKLYSTRLAQRALSKLNQSFEFIYVHGLVFMGTCTS